MELVRIWDTDPNLNVVYVQYAEISVAKSVMYKSYTHFPPIGELGVLEPGSVQDYLSLDGC